MSSAAPVRIHAPDLKGATAWLNADHPLSIHELRGQLVILDFWTYCCVNCLHVLPVLRDLEERHRDDPLLVIGVHSAKFDAEKDAQRVLSAMRRYGVSHPVAVDSDMQIWSAYTVRSWPTLIVVRPDGTLAAVAPGEPDPAVLESFVQQELAMARENGTLAQKPLQLRPATRESEHALQYPGKVTAGGGRIFVADSGHHRVLVLDESGRAIDAIGTGLRGLREGRFAEVVLDDPQGLAFVEKENALYIADARAHAILRADLSKRELRRFAGTGELGRAPISGRTPALETALRSPWDLAARDGELFIALAGSHQLAKIKDGFIEPIAGDGREAQLDGGLGESTLAQPSGLALHGDTLYVADSESSGVRAYDLKTGYLSSLCGGPGLFDFGDKVGLIERGMLQHPLGVAWTDAGLVVADTYNDKLKRFSADQKRLEAFGPDWLSQPAGLCGLPSGDVLVADTNHHRLLRVSPDGPSELTVMGAPAPQHGVLLPPVAPARVAAAGWFTAIIETPAGAGLAPGEGRVELMVRPQEGYEISEGAPWSAAVEVSRRSDLLKIAPELQQGDGLPAAIVLHATTAHETDVDSELLVTLRAVACDARDHSACYPVQNSFRLPLRLLREGQTEVRFMLPLELPR
jgi:thiol-disulfide isomerase/thioredoxin